MNPPPSSINLLLHDWQLTHKKGEDQVSEANSGTIFYFHFSLNEYKHVLKVIKYDIKTWYDLLTLLNSTSKAC